MRVQRPADKLIFGTYNAIVICIVPYVIARITHGFKNINKCVILPSSLSFQYAMYVAYCFFNQN